MSKNARGKKKEKQITTKKMFNDHHYNYILKQMVITRIYKFSLRKQMVFNVGVCNINRNMHKYLIKTNKLICKVHQFILLKNRIQTDEYKYIYL